MLAACSWAERVEVGGKRTNGRGSQVVISDFLLWQLLCRRLKRPWRRDSSNHMASAYLDDPTQADEALDSRARPYQEFLEDNTYNYQDEITRMLNLDQTRLIVNLDDLRAYRRELATAYAALRDAMDSN